MCFYTLTAWYGVVVYARTQGTQCPSISLPLLTSTSSAALPIICPPPRYQCIYADMLCGSVSELFAVHLTVIYVLVHVSSLHLYQVATAQSHVKFTKRKGYNYMPFIFR